MSQENVEAIRRSSQAFKDGDLDRAIELFHPEVVYYERPGNPLDTPDVLHGLDEIRASVMAYITEFPDFHSQIDELLAAGDKVMCVQRWAGTGRSSGIALDLEEIIVYTFKNGKAIEGRVYPDRASAVEAAGVAE